MHKILVFVGSSKTGGNTDQLADAFIQGARDAGHEVHKLFAGTHQLEGCRGCGACQLNGTHTCVVKDYMQEAYPLFDECDTLVLASPLYFWTFSAKMKAFFDRLYATSTEDIYPKKNTYLLMTSDCNTEDTFKYPAEYYQFISNGLGWTDLGMYLAGGCSGDPKGHRIPEHHLKGAYEAGKNLK